MGDIDSTPDANPDNDAGGIPDDGFTDDFLEGLGIIDEDDHDPRSIEVVDFALKLTIDSPDTVRYGESVIFKLSAYNQGNVELVNTDVLIDVGPGYNYDPASNPGWSTDPAEPAFTFAGPIAPGDSVFAFLDLTLLQTQEIADQWVNYGQLVQARDVLGNRDDDADSFAFIETAAENSVKPGDPDDNNIFGLGATFGEDEDDHDPAGPDVFDLALIKEQVTTGRIAYDDIVEYQITVRNQGNQSAQSFTVTDYLPEGLSFDPALQSENWVLDPITNTASLTRAGALDPNISDVFSIFLVVECVEASLTAWTNRAEISAAIDEDGNPAFDLDSTYDTIPDNDIGGTPGSAEDNNLDDSGTDVDNDGTSDEDDSDPAFTEVIDLALRKEVISTAPYTVGQLVDFSITVFNQGNIPLENVQVIDYVPAGLTYDGGDNPGWSDETNGASFIFQQGSTTERLMPGDSLQTVISLTYSQVPGGGVSADFINYAEILSATDTLGNSVAGLDADSDPASDLPSERAVLPDTAGDDDIDSKDQGGNEDDHDPAGIMASDLSLDKRVVTTGPYEYGQLIMYEITVTNEGTVPANNIELSDQIGCGLVYLPINDANWQYDQATSTATTLLPGQLLAGESVSITIALKLQYCDEPFDDLTYNNEAEIESVLDDGGDPFEDDDSTPGNDDDTEDDQDDAPIVVVDLALTKEVVTPATGIESGDPVIFSFTVYNQGNTDLTNVVIEDYIPSGFSLDGGASAGWTASALGAQYIISALLSESDTTVEITLSFSPGLGLVFNNYGEIVGASDTSGVDVTGNDADSTPSNNIDADDREVPNGPGDGDIDADGTDGIEDDNDPAAFGVLDLALDKNIAIPAAGYKYGDTLTYEFIVTNEGSLPALAIEVADRLPCGLEYLPSNDNEWTFDPVDQTAVVELSGPITAGTSVLVTLNLRLVYCDEADAYTNRAEIIDNETPDNPNPIDIDSTPDNDDPDEDDQDETTIPVVDLALTKETIITSFAVGGNVQFLITVYNQGTVDLTDITIIDYLPAGYQLDDASWSDSSDGVTTMIDDLAAGTATTITLNTIILQGTSLQDYINFAEVLDYEAPLPYQDADSNPGSNTQEEQSVTIGSPDDNNITGGGPLVGEDEDDHDVGGFDPFGSIGDFVWKDLDYDGFQDPGEPGVGGVTVALQTCSGVTIRTTVTNADGSYEFPSVLLGQYQLVFDLSSVDGCIATLQDNTSDDRDSDIDQDGMTDCFLLAPGQDLNTIDAGLAGLGDIGDFVWEDLDGDGLQDFNEPGIAGVTVTLFDEWGNPERSTVTDANGNYIFEDVPIGDYYLQFDTGDDDLLTTTPLAGNVNVDSNVDASNGPGTTAIFSLLPDDDNFSIDAGFYRCVTICGKTWYDLDEDSRRDQNENGINGMMIMFWRLNSNGVYEQEAMATAGTDPNTPSGDGYFEVCVRPGTYYVEVPLPPYGLVLARVLNTGNAFTNNDIGTFNGPATSQAFFLASGQGKCDIGAGFYPMATVGRAVWNDQNGNGLREAIEPLVQDVVVEVYNTDDQLISVDVTDATGIYTIDQLQEQDYYLHFAPPAGYTFTVPRVAPNATDRDSDVDHSNGLGTTRLISFSPGDNVIDVDAGLAQGVLPVLWSNVSVDRTDDDHLVRWSTAVEVNASHFIVQRSFDQVNWKDLQRLEAKNVTEGAHYRILDTDTERAGTYYYRIAQYDLDGRYDHSVVVQISAEGDGAIRLFPNPTSTQSQVELPAGVASEIEVISPLGQVVASYNINLGQGTTTHLIDVSSLPAGLYQVIVTVDARQESLPLLVIR